ncbi:class I SAM-dependent methyltransferase [Paracoccus pacificus]|uniref:Class I SAM-dependent methyltransferase n=1 Tax=Paracoccus pacificus TaxID=1463598 RepID=A0ABW4R6L0_9RHOB
MLLPPSDVIGFFPEYRTTQTPWQGLTPVAAWLIRSLRPARVVELGSYRGDSLFSFQQAARDIPEVREIWAVDSWEGDQHTGAYGEGVLAQFEEERARRDDPRVHTCRMLFSEAVSEFDDGSIDLLHIDGAHDYASVRQDFESWLPKMAPDGVIAFHDTVVRKDDFGVWQLWEEIEKDYPGRTFNFTHSNGLGILCLGDRTDNDIQRLGTLTPANQQLIRDAMEIAGEGVVDMTRYENTLITRNGGELALQHRFAAGAELETLKTLKRLEESRTPQVQAEDWSDQRVDDLYAAIAPRIQQEFNTATESLFNDRGDQVFAAMSDRITAAVTDRIDRLLRDQATDVYAALAPQIRQAIGDEIETLVRDRRDDIHSALSDKIAQQIDQRVDRLISDQRNDLHAALTPAIGDQIDLRIDRLLSEQKGDVHAALAPAIDGQIGRAFIDNSDSIRSSVGAGILADLVQALQGDEPQNRELANTIRQLSKDKNEAQDDAIIGLGATVEAHDESIRILRDYLQQVFQHPLFKG